MSSFPAQWCTVVNCWYLTWPSRQLLIKMPRTPYIIILKKILISNSYLYVRKLRNCIGCSFTTDFYEKFYCIAEVVKKNRLVVKHCKLHWFMYFYNELEEKDDLCAIYVQIFELKGFRKTNLRKKLLFITIFVYLFR